MLTSKNAQDLCRWIRGGARWPRFPPHGERASEARGMSGQGSGFGNQHPGNGPGYPPPAPGYPQIMPGYVQPIRKDKTLLYVGLGCGFVVLLLVASVVGVGIWGYFKAKSAMEAVSRDFARMGANSGKPAALGGVICVQASSCCRKVMLKLNNQSEYEKCDNFLDASAPVCQAQLTAFALAANNLDIHCAEESAGVQTALPSAPSVPSSSPSAPPAAGGPRH